jgi:HEAT repeat protein
MTVEELRAQLSMIEPTEGMYAGISDADVPALEQLLSDREEWMASRAVFALSRVGSADAVSAVARAATDQRSPVRVAVAAAVSQRPIVLPDDTTVKLLRDEDVGVRKFATYAVKPKSGNAPRELLNKLASNDPSSVVRENAREVLRSIRR